MHRAPWRPVHTNLLRDLHKTVSPYIKCHRREVFTMANATYSQNDSLGGAPDYARYDRIWQRVAPALDPYPQVRAANQKAVPAMAMTMQQSAAVGETEQTVQNRYTAPGGQTEGQTAASVTQTGDRRLCGGATAAARCVRRSLLHGLGGPRPDHGGGRVCPGRGGGCGQLYPTCPPGAGGAIRPWRCARWGGMPSAGRRNWRLLIT